MDSQNINTSVSKPGQLPDLAAINQDADIYEIRRRNMRLLIKEHANGNLSHFAEVTLGGLASYKGLQHVTGPRAVRNLGSPLARKIEAQLRLERGWLDHDHSGAVHTEVIPGGRSERVVQLVESIESLPPRIRVHLEQIVHTLAQRPSRRRRNKASDLPVGQNRREARTEAAFEETEDQKDHKRHERA